MEDKFLIYSKILERAETLGLLHSSKITALLDIMNADKQFNLRLEEFLHADDFDFAHDFTGIQHHMDRDAMRVVNFFLPRFAGKE